MKLADRTSHKCRRHDRSFGPKSALRSASSNNFHGLPLSHGLLLLCSIHWLRSDDLHPWSYRLRCLGLCGTVVHAVCFNIGKDQQEDGCGQEDKWIPFCVQGVCFCQKEADGKGDLEAWNAVEGTRYGCMSRIRGFWS